MSNKKTTEINSDDLQIAVGAEVIDFLYEHRDELIARAMERIKKAQADLKAKENNETKIEAP